MKNFKITILTVKGTTITSNQKAPNPGLALFRVLHELEIEWDEIHTFKLETTK